MVLDDIREMKGFSDFMPILNHLKDAKLLKKLKGADLIEMYKFTLPLLSETIINSVSVIAKQAFTPKNMEALGQGVRGESKNIRSKRR